MTLELNNIKKKILNKKMVSNKNKKTFKKKINAADVEVLKEVVKVKDEKNNDIKLNPGCSKNNDNISNERNPRKIDFALMVSYKDSMNNNNTETNNKRKKTADNNEEAVNGKRRKLEVDEDFTSQYLNFLSQFIHSLQNNQDFKYFIDNKKNDKSLNEENFNKILEEFSDIGNKLSELFSSHSV